jgi:ribosomal protein S12 methylthiotransferase accessory factor
MEYDPHKRMIGRIEIEISVPSDFPEKYYEALVNSASLCAVKKHMQDPPEFAIFTSVR